MSKSFSRAGTVAAPTHNAAVARDPRTFVRRRDGNRARTTPYRATTRVRSDRKTDDRARARCVGRWLELERRDRAAPQSRLHRYAPPNPLRGLASDAAARSVPQTIPAQ